MKRGAFSWAVLPLVVACSGYSTAPPKSPVVGPESAIPPELARVCVVRSSALAQAVPFPTKDNGVLVGATKGPTHFCYFAAPGLHELSMSADNEATAKLSAEAGHSYTLYQELEFIFGVVRVRPSWITPERARELLEGTEYAVLTAVPGAEKLPEPTSIVPAK